VVNTEVNSDSGSFSGQPIFQNILPPNFDMLLDITDY
jgi:hypothetical protein